MDNKTIEKQITIEELVEKHPFTIKLLSKKNIRCIACGEPVWGTLEEAAKEKGFTNEQIDAIVAEINSNIISPK